MPAKLEIDEINTSGVRTHGVTNLNVGSIDAPSIQVTPLVGLRVGANAFTKYNVLHFTNLGTASAVNNLRVWKTPDKDDLLRQQDGQYAEFIATNLETDPLKYTPVTFDTPSQFKYACNSMPDSKPASANLGIAGVLSGVLLEPGYSDIWKWQIQLQKRTMPGVLKTKVFYFAWDEQ